MSCSHADWYKNWWNHSNDETCLRLKYTKEHTELHYNTNTDRWRKHFLFLNEYLINFKPIFKILTNILFTLNKYLSFIQ